jgi:hypothetical protein
MPSFHTHNGKKFERWDLKMGFKIQILPSPRTTHHHNQSIRIFTIPTSTSRHHGAKTTIQPPI